MASLDELRAERIKKIDVLRSAGMDPYPSFSKTDNDGDIRAIRNDFDVLVESSGKISLSGRIMAIRGQGALLFIDVYDGTDKMQVVFKKGDTPDDLLILAKNTLDVGDFIFVRGLPFVTSRGERSIMVDIWNMLSKSLQPLPDKWHGVTDEELRYRKRYLDILMNGELRDMFEKKAQFWKVVRAYMDGLDFMEVETPTFELTTGGAEARPFQTHHHDSDMDLYLRISVGELWQKRLLVAGFPKTYEIGRVFRNEGTSPHHVQEFTNMEFYWSYANYEDAMKVVETLYTMIAREVFHTTQFTVGEHVFDFARPWGRVSYREEVKKHTGIDVLSAHEDEMIRKLEELNVAYEGTNRERLMDTLWKYCRKQISGPVFLIDHPKLVSPLAKAKKDAPELTERFQVIIAGTEVGNGYTELNDPQEQKKRFEIQQALLAEGDEEAMMPDDEFVEALEHGMPPACGFGFGERLFSLLIGKPIRETHFFPLMKPRGGE